MYDRKSTGLRIKECRNRMGVTQEKMSEDVGFTRTKISNWETARRDICMTDAIQICEYFDVSLETLFRKNREVSTNDFLIIAKTYSTNKKFSKKERRESLKSLFKYL